MPKKPIEEADGWIYYWCPITGEGLYDIPHDYGLVHRRNPKRTEAVVPECPSCKEPHVIVFRDPHQK